MNISTIPNEDSIVSVDNPLGIELRGYEVAKDTGNTQGSRWEVVSKWRPNNRGLLEAQKACDWLNQRRVDQKLAPIYAVRPIVSMFPVAPAEEKPEEDKQLPLPGVE